MHANSGEEGMKDALQHQLMKINGGLIELKQTMIDQMYKYSTNNQNCKEFIEKHEEELEKIDQEIKQANYSRNKVVNKNLADIFLGSNKDSKASN